MRRLAIGALLSLAGLALGGCSLTRMAYDHADTMVRFMADSYLDLDESQAADLSARISRLHQWHRLKELPEYASLLRSASARAARGINAEDVAWGLGNVRVRYRHLAAEAMREAAPVLATLEPGQVATLEHRFAEENEKYASKYLSTDAEKRRDAQLERALKRMEDFTGSLTDAQEALVQRFVIEHERHVALRFEDRRRWQREVLALLARRPKQTDLAERLADTFQRPELRRTEAFLREDRRWDEDLARLFVDLDRTLSAKQRAHLVRRLQDYADDFAALARIEGKPA